MSRLLPWLAVGLAVVVGVILQRLLGDPDDVQLDERDGTLPGGGEP